MCPRASASFPGKACTDASSSRRLVRHIVLALRRARTHRDQLNQAYTKLGHFLTLVLAVGDARGGTPGSGTCVKCGSGVVQQSGVARLEYTG